MTNQGNLKRTAANNLLRYMAAALGCALALSISGCKPPDVKENAAKKAPAKPEIEEQLNSSDPRDVIEGSRRAADEWGAKDKGKGKEATKTQDKSDATNAEPGKKPDDTKSPAK